MSDDLYFILNLFELLPEKFFYTIFRFSICIFVKNPYERDSRTDKARNVAYYYGRITKNFNSKKNPVKVGFCGEICENKVQNC